MYWLGQGVSRNYAEALKWYRLAADQGAAKAQYALGFMYQFGDGVPRNYAEALKWFRLAADQGEAAAQANLGGMYQFGQGVPQSYAEAVKWYRLAAAVVTPPISLATISCNKKGQKKPFHLLSSPIGIFL
jgi:uncharacterized protein